MPNNDELQRAMQESRDRLNDRGVTLTGHESAKELVTLLEAVETFEVAVEAKGGDLMVDEGPGGKTTEPDDLDFVLPQRAKGESVASYLVRIGEATYLVEHHGAVSE